MAAQGVTAIDIDRAIRRDNFISAAGTTEGNLVRVTVDARTDMQTPVEFAALVVRQDGDKSNWQRSRNSSSRYRAAAIRYSCP